MINKYSKQREMILEIIKNTRIHPTSEEVYEMAKEKDSKISKSTVYRNINILVENGIIEKISMKNSPDRLDYIQKMHYHVICEKCGKVFDFYYDFEKEKILESIKKQTGLIIKTESITIEGVCDKCKSKI